MSSLSSLASAVTLFSSIPFTLASNSTSGYSAARTDVASQWSNPADVLSVLLIIGGDVVQKALAQLCGETFVPVPFSFGWVAYSFSVLMAVFGDGKIMPTLETDSFVINTATGYKRRNRSWILGRILRDHEIYTPYSLKFSVFYVKSRKPEKDWVWYSGVIVMFVQLLLSIEPLVKSGNWVILMVTAMGTILCLCDGALPQWRKEKYCGSPKSRKSIALTRGNGSRYVMLLISTGDSIDLEDNAAGHAEPDIHTRYVVAIFSFLRFLLLITVAGLKRDMWCLLIIGAVGMAQNVFAAAAPRKPEAYGLTLLKTDTIEGGKVMWTLMEMEKKYPGVGLALLKEFFPGPLRTDEAVYWEKVKARRSIAPILKPARSYSV